jgi:hypothetical protein
LHIPAGIFTRLYLLFMVHSDYGVEFRKVSEAFEKVAQAALHGH